MTPPPEARASLAAALAPLHGAPGEPRWTPPDRWHLTLLFLGGTPEAAVPGLRDALGAAVEGTPPMTLRLEGGGRFGSRRRPQVCWTGVGGDVAALSALARRVAAAARRLRLPVEDRPFRAHLTLGRWRPGAPADGDLPDRLAGYRGPDWPVTEVSLVESRLGPQPVYTTVADWPVTTRTPSAPPGNPGRSRPAGPAGPAPG